ncbi:PREDICTED: F-actin-uncapping protein LRRC16A-like isoform X7 [Branchiostoma belcheri]|uniref:F-actin-uncapping protein LRRC16A-like isoform X7 n=1 Tax=Branchiostoma belcheri TaxID=7741 RepID=A0A6P4ZIR6_BRABE|nr:PREDICTED: F-actin-uncapping protein LRRC16A-like isoform X7 [Branchiostoma belcheri]
MAGQGSRVPQDISENVRAILGKGIKVGMKKLIKLQTGSKEETKVLALSQSRAFIFSAKVPTKLESSFHYLNIQSIASLKTKQLHIEAEDKRNVFKPIEAEDAEHIIGHIGVSLKRTFPDIPRPLHNLLPSLLIEPLERMKNVQRAVDTMGSKEKGPCGGFSAMYTCMCDFHNLPVREEVIWDVDTIYLSQANRELCLDDFNHMDSKDLGPIISALEHNTWFTKLSSYHTRLAEHSDQLCKVMKKNAKLEELVLENAGLNKEFAKHMATALLSNTNSALHTVSLSHNHLEDRGVNAISGPICKLPRGLQHLNLTKVGMTAKGVSHLALQLMSTSQSLKQLHLADNMFRAEDILNLQGVFAQPNGITHLDLAGTECAIDPLFGAFKRGCIQHIQYLSLGRNTFTHKKSKEPVIASASFKEFFLNCQSLKHVSLSGTKLPPDAVKSLFLGLSGNFVLRDVHVDLSNCELKKTGGEMLESTIANVPCIATLDISDNGFDEHMETMLSWIGQNKAIRYLNISKNFSGIRPRHLPKVLEAVKKLIQEDNSSIDSLCLADSKLKENLIPILNVLGSNNSLTSLDISGNGMGDFGARMLSKALQINSKLRTIMLDKNGITTRGFQDLGAALEKNHTLQNMPTPVSDASQALRMDEAGTEEALQKIETLLLRNQRPLKMTSDRIYRLQQGVLITTAQQMVEQLSRKVQDIRAVLKDSKSPQVQAALQESDRLISDADNSKQLLPLLYKQGAGTEGEQHPLETKLGSLTKQMQEETDRHMASSVDNVLKYGQQQCPHILQTQGLKQALEQECRDKSKLPDKLVEDAIVNQAGTTIVNKVRESELHIATFVSDKVIEELLESLAKNHATLQNIAQNHVEPEPASPSHRPTEVEKPEESPQSPTASPPDAKLNQVQTPSPQLSPKIDNKRRSVVQRMQRPMSIMGEENVKLDLSSGSDEDQSGRQTISSVEEEPMYEDIDSGPKAEESTQPVAPSRKSRRKPEKSSSTGSSSSNDVSELPTEGARLEHLTKGRIKAPKTAGVRRRPVPNRGVPNSVENSPEGTMDAGLDDFFEKKALDVVLSEETHAVNGEKSPPAAGPSSLQKEESQRKKKKSMFSQLFQKSPGRSKEKSPEVAQKKSLEKTRPPPAPTPSPPPVKEEREERSSPEQTETKPTAIQEEEEEVEDTEKVEEQPTPEEKPRSSDAEENPTDDAPEDAEETPAVKEPVALRRPAGVPKGFPGMSGGLLAEMKKKQEKRATMLPPPEMSASPVQDSSTSPSVSPGSIRRREEKNTAASPSLENKPAISPSMLRRHNKDDSPTASAEGLPPKPAKRRSRDSAVLEPNGPNKTTDPSKSPTSPIKEDTSERNKISPAVKAKPKPPATRPKPLAKPKVPVRPKSAEVGKLLLEESSKKPEPMERQLPPRAAASAEKINIPKLKDDMEDPPQGKSEEKNKEGKDSTESPDATDSNPNLEVPKVCVETAEAVPKPEGDTPEVKGRDSTLTSTHQPSENNHGNPTESEDSPAANAPSKRPSVMDRIKSFSGKDEDVPMKAKSRSLPRDLDSTAEVPEPAAIPRSQSMDSADKLKPANGEKSEKEEETAKDDVQKESEETQVMV